MVKINNKNTFLGMCLAWLIPGLGHLYIGKRTKALFFFIILAVTYIAGLWMSGFHTVRWSDNPFYYLGHFGSAVTLITSNYLGKEKAFPQENIVSWFDPGLLYVCIAGVLNLLIVLSFLDPATYRKEKKTMIETATQKEVVDITQPGEVKDLTKLDNQSEEKKQ